MFVRSGTPGAPDRIPAKIARRERPGRPGRPRGRGPAAHARAVGGRAARGVPGADRGAQRRRRRASTARPTRSTRGRACTPSSPPSWRGPPTRGWHRGRRRPLLCGIPLALKDLFAVGGLRLTASSRVLEEQRRRGRQRACGAPARARRWCSSATPTPTSSPPAGRRIRSATRGRRSARRAGRAAGRPPRWPPVWSRQRWARTRSARCGSPPRCAGTSAIKATHGRVPIDGVIALRPSLDHAGPMARSIADCSRAARRAGGRRRAGDAADAAARPRRPAARAARRAAPAGRAGRGRHGRPEAARRSTPTWPTGSWPPARRAGGWAQPGLSPSRSPTRPAADMTRSSSPSMGAEHEAHAAEAERYRPSIRELVDVAVAATDAGALPACPGGPRRG